MSISAFMGANSIIKPGVVTSTTRPSAPFVGQLIFETDTNRLAAYNGTTWITQNGLQLLSQQTIGSAVSSVTVSNCFSAAYDHYKITIVGGAGSSANASIRMTLGSTATNYYYGIPLTVYSGGAYASLLGNNQTYWEVGSINTASLNLNMELIDPFNTRITKMFAQVVKDTSAGSGGGYLNDTTSYSSFTLTPSAGTLTGGVINVFGFSEY